jgi:hypothetical protein
MGHKFQTKASEYTDILYVYVSVSTNDINPIELEKEANDFVKYMFKKYHKQTIKNMTFMQWINYKLKQL